MGIMEEVFKQNLLMLREQRAPKTFSEALSPGSLWRPKSRPGTAPTPEKILISDEFSEKKQVIESFERFASEKLKESPSCEVQVEGGVIAQKPRPQWEGVNVFSNQNELIDSLKLPVEFKKIVFKNKVQGKISVIFVTEIFRPWQDAEKELKDGFINELLVGLPSKTAELFERMIGAMKLTPDEVLLYPIEFDGADFSSELISIAAYFKPEVIITLGARATQKILKTNDRLTLVHGQFFQRSFEDGHTFQVVPLFHPSIIETNQNMKKTAWADMQKIMKHLKKLP